MQTNRNDGLGASQMALVALMHSTIQIICMFSAHSAGQLVQRMISIAAAQLMWVPALFDYGWYVHHKRHLAAATRLIVWAVPVVWQPVGLQDVMRARPSRGALGWAADALRLGIGTRMLGVMYGSLVAPTALLPHLALQLYALGMLRHNTTLCSATLLSHPVAAGRLRMLVSLLDILAMSGSPCTALLLLNRTWEPTTAHDCRLFLILNEILVGMILPTMVLVRYLPTVATARLRRLHAAGASKSVLYRAELAVFFLFGGRQDWGLAPGERPASWGGRQLAMVWWCILSGAWVLATSVPPSSDLAALGRGESA